LAAIAIPSYQNYTRRAYYSEVVQATAPYRVAVGECVQDTGSLTACNAGSNNIPAAIAAPVGAVTSLDVAAGVITVVPVEDHGIVAADTYVLTPTVGTGGTVTWVSSGGGVTNNYAK
jgi:type IV pilus assembly protein PilA